MSDSNDEINMDDINDLTSAELFTIWLALGGAGMSYGEWERKVFSEMETK